MGTALFHPNMVIKCKQKKRYDTESAAREKAADTMTIMFFAVCSGYHRTHRRHENYLGMTATPDEVLEMFR